MTAGSPSNRVGLALIAKNEAERLPNLLASIEGCFDRVVLLDTGSTDGTIKVFQKWATKQTGMTFSIGRYEWTHDFAAARTAADNLLIFGIQAISDPSDLSSILVNWTSWADCDDIIVGAQNIKRLVADAPPTTSAFLCDYEYARHQDSGVVLSYLRRERIVRAGMGTWIGRVHEAQVITSGNIQAVDPGVLRYVHNKHMSADSVSNSNSRNLEILEKWNEDEPDNPRVLGYLGVETALQNRHKEAIEYYKRYLELPTGWDEERAQVHSRLASSLMALQDFDGAIDVALEAFRVIPSWPDTMLRLAEAYLAKQDAAKAEQWARMALNRGAPQDTLLIVNPLDYSFLPLKLLAGAVADLGNASEAIALGKEALAIHPDEQLALAMHHWQVSEKRHKTAETFVMCCQQLISHDEQFKALNLIENCVPVFATDHPSVVAMRSSLRERINWAINPDVNYSVHYEVGGSKPEDMIPDDFVNTLCERLPRTGFLLDGVCEQLGVE